MSEVLNEQALRRPEFQGGVPLELADGQTWYLARPDFYFVDDDSEAGLEYQSTLGPEYDALLKAFDAAQEAMQGSAVIKAQLRLARFLMVKNYDLSTDQLAQLLRFGFGAGNPYNALREAVMEVALGRTEAPKAPGDGSGLPSSPTGSTPAV